MGEERTHWSRYAQEWIDWARTPGHDSFWAFRAGFADFVGRGTGDALDLGCGEGRISRLLKESGYRVFASDVVTALVEAAARVDSAQGYAVADAAALPFANQSFDVIVAYNVLMDVADVPATVWEIRRVLRPDGRLVTSIVHPFRDWGEFAGPEHDAPFLLRGSYYGRRYFSGEEARDGLRMHFAGWSQPLEAYAAALEEAGLAITALREPLPDLVDRDDLRRWTRVPMFLWLKARPLTP